MATYFYPEREAFESGGLLAIQSQTKPLYCQLPPGFPFCDANSDAVTFLGVKTIPADGRKLSAQPINTYGKLMKP